MNREPHKHPDINFQDSNFPGRKLIAWAVGLWVIVVLMPDSLPKVQTILLLPAILLYFVGFWQGVVGKGYPKVLFLISLAPFIGLLILFFLPSRDIEFRVSPESDQKSDEEAASYSESNQP